VTQCLADRCLSVTALLQPFGPDTPRVDERTGAVMSNATQKGIAKASGADTKSDEPATKR
jgi:hypothetical protein